MSVDYPAEGVVKVVWNGDGYYGGGKEGCYVCNDGGKRELSCGLG